MNRERAEIFLRLLAEAELRDPALALRRLAAPVGGRPVRRAPVTLTRAAWALTAVGALDLETAEAILADAELAVAARLRPSRGGRAELRRARAGAGCGPAPVRRRPAAGPDEPPDAAVPAPAPAPAGAAPPDGPDRYVPVGLMVLFHDELISGELDLMSYAHTAAGARLIATWRTRDLLGSRHHGLPPVEAFTVTDDRGQSYDLLFATKGRPESTCDLTLRPDPPPGIGWLEITAPGEKAVRIDLHRRAEDPRRGQRDRPQHRRAPAEPDRGAAAHPGPGIPRWIGTRRRPPTKPGPLVTNLAAGLGATIAALEAAEVLSPHSPVPGRLAALCASLGIRGHGITAAPAPDLPEPWLSMLSHYHRRKPDAAPAGDGFAAVAAALPELEGIRLVLLGLHNYDGGTWMNALALGQLPGLQHGPLGLDMAFPLSIWVRDDTGRWHAARPAGWYQEGGEAALTLRLTPPLTRSSAWIEVLATGQSAEVRATVPLCWGYR